MALLGLTNNESDTISEFFVDICVALRALRVRMKTRDLFEEVLKTD